MDELVKAVSERTGLSEAQAKVAVETVISQLKSRLPAPVASQIDSFLAGGGSTGGLSDLAGGLGGLMGKK
jgi:hypothetical protein